jgi:hypothetical protein
VPLWSANNHLHSKCRFSGVGRMSGNTCPDKCCGPGICRTMCLSRHTASVACLSDRMPDGAYAGRHVSDSTQRDALAPGTAPAARHLPGGESAGAHTCSRRIRDTGCRPHRAHAWARPRTDRAASRQRTPMHSQNPRYRMQAASRVCLGRVPEHPADSRVLPAAFPRAQDVSGRQRFCSRRPSRIPAGTGRVSN